MKGGLRKEYVKKALEKTLKAMKSKKRERKRK